MDPIQAAPATLAAIEHSKNLGQDPRQMIWLWCLLVVSFPLLTFLMALWLWSVKQDARRNRRK